MTMRTRRGFTLIELMVGIVLVTMVTAIIYSLLLSMQQMSRRQAEQSNLQENVRAGAMILPAELREIGYDSSQVTGAVTSDLLVAEPNRVRFRAMRGLGITCALVANELRVWKPMFQVRAPAVGDGLLLFVERNASLAADDDWLQLAVSAVDMNSDCGGQPAIRLTLATAIDGGLMSSIFVGGPLRVFQPMEFGLYTSDGRSWLGARSAEDDAYQPVLGPLADGDGFALSYLDNAGNSTINHPAVRTIKVTLRGRSDEPVKVGPGAPQIVPLNLDAYIALRNNLRP
jgi:prepilin-type N-terminal cleavage/methylation domain-containing protein